jgi:hypothetical protein
MHCWKTINLDKQFGFYRIFFLSLFVMMMVFSVIYVPINLIISQDLYDSHFYYFLFGAIIVYPLHKLLHLIPILRYMNKVKYKVKMYFGIFPVFSFRVDTPIPKYRYIIALLFPFITLTVVFLFGCLYFPHYAHYFTILMAYHTGVCAIDFIYAKSLMYSPRHAMIEENEDGYEILIYQ